MDLGAPDAANLEGIVPDPAERLPLKFYPFAPRPCDLDGGDLAGRNAALGATFAIWSRDLCVWDCSKLERLKTRSALTIAPGDAPSFGPITRPWRIFVVGVPEKFQQSCVVAHPVDEPLSALALTAMPDAKVAIFDGHILLMSYAASSIIRLNRDTPRKHYLEELVFYPKQRLTFVDWSSSPPTLVGVQHLEPYGSVLNRYRRIVFDAKRRRASLDDLLLQTELDPFVQLWPHWASDARGRIWLKVSNSVWVLAPDFSTLHAFQCLENLALFGVGTTDGGTSHGGTTDGVTPDGGTSDGETSHGVIFCDSTGRYVQVSFASDTDNAAGDRAGAPS